jgi:hypothetical protein
MPTLSGLARRFADRGFMLVLLSADNAPSLATFYASHPTAAVKGRLTSPELVPSFYHAYDACPISYLIDRNGLVVDAWLGAPPPEWIENRVSSEL